MVQPSGVFVEARRDWRLKPTPKYAAHGVVRTIPPAETIRRITPLLATVGVTRVAEVTGLDRVGIPNYTTLRPRERGARIAYYNGKGATRAAAHAGALMEAIERYSAERCDLPVYFCDRATMQRRGATVDPAELILPTVTEYRPELRLEWVEGFDLLTQRPTFVPLNAVLCPYEPPSGRPLLYELSTNGLAAGNTLEEALCHALCEVIERDAMALCDAWLDLAPAIGRVIERLGLAAATRAAAAAARRFPLIDLDSLPPRALLLLRKLRRAGLDVYLRDAGCTAGIATLDCVIVERHWDGQHLAHGGSGAHPDARVAVSRALTEAAQSRLSHIQGGREDLAQIAGRLRQFDPQTVFGGAPVRPFASIASYEYPNIDDDLRLLLERINNDGFSQVVAVDLTRPELGVPVVRVVVPRAEAWSVFVTHARRARIGPRIAGILYGQARQYA